MEQRDKIVISTELSLIIALLKNQLNENSIQQIEIIKNQVLSWSQFVSLVIHHRLVTVVYTNLQKLGVELPVEEAKRLKHHFELERKKNFILNASLISLNEVLTKELDVLWFKGVVQSQRMYNNPLARSYSDLDLYIDKADLQKLDNLLRFQGYQPIMDWTKFSKSHFSKYSEFIKEMAYVHEKTGVCIDVHWNLVMSPELFPFSFKEVYQSAKEFTIHNKTVKSLNDYHNFIYLNIHGCFDHWKYLAQLFDVTASLHESPNLKVGYNTYLNQHKLDKSLFLGIEFSDVLFQDVSVNSIEIENLVSKFENPFHAEEEGKLDRLNFFKRQWRYHRSLNYRKNCFEANFFYGDNEDLWRLPRSLFFLYYISVPFRWLGRKIRRKKSLS